MQRHNITTSNPAGIRFLKILSVYFYETEELSETKQQISGGSLAQEKRIG